ncbi:peptidase family C50-domain-containing protein [Xylariaceae sp. FL0255]|nr:peptidase family C50-domain-containing protein [Xylariaceae sp. FL0255]
MSSNTAQIDAIRSAIISASTCNATISTLLKELLQGTQDDNNEPSKPPSKTVSRKTVQPASKAKPSTQVKKQSKTQSRDQLSPKEKANLATEVINITTKALGEAAKAPPLPKPKLPSPSEHEEKKPVRRAALRRSMSAPPEPLQPRSLNRVATSPTDANAKSTSNSTHVSTGCLALVECARIAFATLRSLQASNEIQLPELQLEHGISSFLNKLLALNLFEHATKELRILKRRLEGMAVVNKSKKSNLATANAGSTTKTLSDLLDYPSLDVSGPVCSLIITSQFRALQILIGLKKLTHLEAALPFLRQSNPSSPLSLLLSSVHEDKVERAKTAKQLESLSLLLFSLAPSLAQKDDCFAMDSRLSPSASAALEVQVLGFIARLESWHISGHKGDVEKAILAPLNVCLSAFKRRNSFESVPVLVAFFEQIWRKMEKLGIRVTPSSDSSLVPIYQLLATTSTEAGKPAEAEKWIIKLRSLTNPQRDSVAKCCAVTAQLLTLSLKDLHEVDENLIMQVLDGIQGSLSGNSAELDDLFANICLLRKAAINTLIKHPKCGLETCRTTRRLLENFIIQLPRFANRWLGKPPDPKSPTKDRLRYEQRRQALAKYRNSILDSIFVLIRTQLEEGRSAWDITDAVLQESLNMLEITEQIGSHTSETDPSNSYHVKISHIYYQQHHNLQSSTADGQEVHSLRALQRSVDSVKQQSAPEQTRAQLLVKWEKLANLYLESGRREQAIETFRSIQAHLVREEVVEAITAHLSTHSVTQSWKMNVEAELLSRTICKLTQLERKHNDWTWLLTDEHKATALEHDLYYILANDNRRQHVVELSNQSISKLLDHHTSIAHPVRRLRVLCLLLTTNMDNQDQLYILQNDITATLAVLESGKLGDDSGIASYVPYLRHYAACILALATGELESTDIQQAVSGMKSILVGCQSSDQLDKIIDDPPRLLKTLQSLADFAKMKGLQNLLTDLIELGVTVARIAAASNAELHVAQSVSLCLHYLALGRSNKAEKILQTVADKITLPQISAEILSDYHLSAAEYHLAVGCVDKAEQHLVKAHGAAAEINNQRSRKKRNSNNKIVVAYAHFLTANLAHEKGEHHRALRLAKNAVMMLLLDWKSLEERRISSSDVIMEDSSQANSSGEESSTHDSSTASIDASWLSTGPEFWALVYPLFRFVSRLSSLYAHVGMYQETMHYGQQALKVAKSMNSPSFVAQATAWMASISLMAEESTKSIELATKAKAVLLTSEPTYDTITALCQIASVYHKSDSSEYVVELIAKAELMLGELKMTTEGSSTSDDLETELSKLTLKEPLPIRTKARVPVAAKKTTRILKKLPPKNISTKEMQPSIQRPITPEQDDIQLNSIRLHVLQLQLMIHLENKDWATAITSLQSAAQMSKLFSDLAQEHFFLGMSLIGQSLEQMGTDSVFSSIQDSTLSFPAIAAAVRDRHSLGHSPQQREPPPGKATAMRHATQSFIEKLQAAQDHLLEAHAIARVNGNGTLVNRIATALQNVAILLLSTDTSNIGAGYPAYATCSVELARNLIWRRERKANKHESEKHTAGAWPMVIDNSDHRRSSLGPTVDMHQFYREYVNIIPKAWNVLSLSLSEDKHDLCITKLQAGHSPFALRLPLERANSRDIDNEVFDFQQGRAELIEIIEMANRTSHEARDLSQEETRSAWWAERQGLDDRLKQLLDNVEENWLGGFKGIFSQHHKRSDLLARFQKSFHNILEKYLPSRQSRGKKIKSKAPKVNLDPRILDLFIGLGDPTAQDIDMDEPLMDLLYFVVDVLQFHGELNAYDEIEFDDMVVETTDALHSYHAVAKSAKSVKGDQEGTHTILILDKSLHAFPWESLPCLNGLAVSRVPSLDCLRRLIMESQSLTASAKASGDSTSDDELSSSSGSLAGHYASINSGTYILNPGEDLVNTQATFGQALASLPHTWTSIETREPSENEFQKALTDRDILLYFGHGSGAQYIRSRTVRQMEKCRATTLLMGCSSASLIHVGDFEPYGPVWNYMLAGAPAVVGTLWDVTDRDIDRFAGSLFEEWGLFLRGTFSSSEQARGKAKGRVKAAVARKKGGGEYGKASLVEAIAKARVGACRLKYLTAAAVVVYGIPVYVAR